MRRQLPSATVTFLFTDVEGSTRLLQELGAEAYAEALAEHRRVLRKVLAAEGGVEVDTQGDAFFYVFTDARAAVAAGAAGNVALEPGLIRIRMGLHTGEALLTGGGLRRRGRPSRCTDRGSGARWAGVVVGGHSGVAGRRRDRPWRASRIGDRLKGREALLAELEDRHRPGEVLQPPTAAERSARVSRIPQA
jgi:hypothetical protein